jgi:hypothetical protein
LSSRRAEAGTASLFINSAGVPNTLDFTVVNDGSGLTLAVGTSCSVSITFSPTLAGARSAQLIVTDNAPNSPGGVCDIGAGSNVFVNNFFTTTFQANGGTPRTAGRGRSRPA